MNALSPRLLALCLLLVAGMAHAQVSSKDALDYLLRDWPVTQEQFERGLMEDVYTDSSGVRVPLNATAEQREQIAERLVEHYPIVDIIPMLEKAVALNGGRNNQRLLAMLALGYLEQNQPDKALQTAERTLQRTIAGDADALSRYASVMIHAGRSASVLPRLEQLAQTNPQAWNPAFMQLADAMEAIAEDIDDAATGRAAGYKAATRTLIPGLLELARKHGGLDARHYAQLGNLYGMQEGKERQAIAVLEEGLAKGVLPSRPRVYASLASFYYFAGDKAKAIALWQQWGPQMDTGESLLNLARALLEAGRTDDAKRAAQAALDKGGLRSPDDARKILLK